MAIDLKEALVILKSGEWLSLRCLTADLVKEDGGKLIKYEECRIARKKGLNESKAATTGITDTERPANHNANFTLNLELKNGQIRKIHPILITHINNLQVL